MAESDNSVPDSVGVPDKGSNDIPPLSLGQTGFTGLITLGGQVLEEASAELRWPAAINTFKKMEKDATIAPALELVEMMMARADWSVKIPKGHEDKLKPYANFLEQCMGDMTHDFKTFIKSASTFSRYGFSINEIVLRERRRDKGSRYDDGLIGIKALPTRSQDSVSEWVWKDSGRELAGFHQRVLGAGSEYSGWDFINDPKRPAKNKFIPRKKFLHFRNSNIKDSPVSTSPLVSVWQAWKLKCAYQESLAMAVAQDSNGFKVLYLPPQYMQANASAENKAVFEEYKNVLKSAHQAKQSGIILPLITDDQGNKMFEFDVKSMTGRAAYDVVQIIQNYNNEILLGLFADVLALGQGGGGGSFSLSESKMDIIQMSVESKLEEIKSQLNHQLIPLVFSMNGWDLEVLPFFEFSSVGKVSLDEASKYIQRVKAVGLLPATKEVVQWVLDTAGINYQLPQDITQEELDLLLGDPTSRSGDGMSSGMGNGTSNNVSTDDNSISNVENSAKDYRIIAEDSEYVTVEMNGKAVLWMKEDWDNFKGEPDGP